MYLPCRVQIYKLNMTVKIQKLLLRGLVLFAIGVLFSVVLNLLQVQRQVTLFPGLVDNIFASHWWVAPSCGTAAGMWVVKNIE